MQEKPAHTVGSRLKRLIRQRGQTYKAFAEDTGISYRTLEAYLSDISKPGAEQLTKMALAGIDVNLLLTGRSRGIGIPQGIIQKALLPDEDAYYILADDAVIRAIDARAKRGITGIMKDHLIEGDDLTFDQLMVAYLQLFHVLAEIFVGSRPPIKGARDRGMSVEAMIENVLEGVERIAAVKLSVAMKTLKGK